MKNLFASVAIVAMSSTGAFAGTAAEDCSTFEECKAVAIGLQDEVITYYNETAAANEAAAEAQEAVDAAFEALAEALAATQAAKAEVPAAYANGQTDGYNSATAVVAGFYNTWISGSTKSLVDMVNDIEAEWSAGVSEAATQAAFSNGYNAGYSSGYGIAESDYQQQVENLETTVSSLEGKITATQDAVDDLLSSWSISLSDSTNIPLAVEKIADKANLAGYYEGLDIGYDDGHSTALTSISEAFNDEFPTYITFGNSVDDIVEAVSNAAYSKVSAEFNQLIKNEGFQLQHAGGSEWILSNSVGSWIVDLGNIAEQAANSVYVANVEFNEDTSWVTVTLSNGQEHADLTITSAVNAYHAEQIAEVKADIAHVWEVNTGLKGELFTAREELEAANDKISSYRQIAKHVVGWVKDFGAQPWIAEQASDMLEGQL